MAAIDAITNLYVGYFNRAPDPAGLNFWVTRYTALGETPAALAGIANSFSQVPEATNLYSFLSAPVVGSPTSFLNSLYLNLFGRAIDVAGSAFWAGQLALPGAAVGQIIINIISGATGDDALVVTNKSLVGKSFAQTLIDTNTAFNAGLAATALTGVTKDAATATAKVLANNTAIAATAGSAGGQTFVLTAAADVLTGTGSNDTFIADNSGATPTLTIADQLNGGGGTGDLLSIFLAAAATATGQPTFSNIEAVKITGGAVTAYTAATGTTSLALDGGTAGATLTLAGQSLSLANRNALADVVAAGATSTHTSQDLTLSNMTGAGSIDINGTKVATLNLTSSGSTNSTTLTNTGTALATLNISGDKTLNVTEGLAGLTTINASAATGSVNVNASTAAITAAFKFTGGSGNDSLRVIDNGLASLASGAQLDGGAGTADKLRILDTALTATELARIGQTVGFEVLGMDAALTLDASTTPTFKNFSVDTAALTNVITNLATGSSTTLAASSTSLTLGTAVGISDHSIILGGSPAVAGVTATALVITGITTVSLTSNAASPNTITAITNSDNSNFTIKGSTDLTMTLAAGTAVGSTVDAAAGAFTGKLNVTGSNLTGSGDILRGGSGADTINGRSGADTLTGNGGADTFSFTATAGVNAGGAAFGQADVITDFVIGVDKLQFAGVADAVSGQQGAVQTAVTALAVGSTDIAIATAMATANTTNLGVSFATFGGNTYVLYETAGAGVGVAADDVFIKLTGITTLPTFTADVIA